MWTVVGQRRLPREEEQDERGRKAAKRVGGTVTSPEGVWEKRRHPRYDARPGLALSSAVRCPVRIARSPSPALSDFSWLHRPVLSSIQIAVFQAQPVILVHVGSEGLESGPSRHPKPDEPTHTRPHGHLPPAVWPTPRFICIATDTFAHICPPQIFFAVQMCQARDYETINCLRRCCTMHQHLVCCSYLIPWI